jgi:hypothetical protein
MDFINGLLLILILAVVVVHLVIEIKRSGVKVEQHVSDVQNVGAEMITSAHTIIANLLAKIPNQSSVPVTPTTAAAPAVAETPQPAPAPQVVVIPKP